MKDNEACRKAFDKIAVDKCYDLTPGLEMDFFFDRTQNAWEGFQAACNLKPKLSVEDIKGVINNHSSIVDLPPDDSTEAILWCDYDALAQAIYEKLEEI